MVLAAVSASFGFVLFASGVVKLRTPDPTQVALAAFRMPSTRWAAQVLGGVEVLVGALVLFFGGVVQLAGGALYVGFTAAVAPIVLGRIDLASCGCFGDRSTKPGYIHLVVNGAGAVVFFWMYIGAFDPFVVAGRGSGTAAGLGWSLAVLLYALAIMIMLTRGAILERRTDSS